MPVEHASEAGRPGFRWGGSTTVYPYDPASTPSIRRAHFLATQQGLALLARSHGDTRLDARARAAALGPRPAWPTRIEDTYRRQLLARTKAANTLLLERILPVLARTGIDERAEADRTDSIESDLASLLRVIETTHRAYEAASKPSVADLAKTATQLDLFTTKGQARYAESVAAISVESSPAARDLIKAWTRENVDLIKSIDSRYFGDIRATIQDAVRSGRQTREIVTLLRERYDVSRSRAELIATDQIAKLNGTITMKRQTDLGVKKYRWSTSLDARVRPEHRIREGKVFSWGDAPADGHPGQPIRCRCVALALFEDDDQSDKPVGASAFRGAFAR